jgi:hypothetical protein
VIGASRAPSVAGLDIHDRAAESATHAVRNRQCDCRRRGRCSAACNIRMPGQHQPGRPIGRATLANAVQVARCRSPADGSRTPAACKGRCPLRWPVRGGVPNAWLVFGRSHLSRPNAQRTLAGSARGVRVALPLRLLERQQLGAAPPARRLHCGNSRQRRAAWLLDGCARLLTSSRSPILQAGRGLEPVDAVALRRRADSSRRIEAALVIDYQHGWPRGRGTAPLMVVLVDAALYGQNVATIVPVPGWPGFGAYPGSVLTTTIFPKFPAIVLPDLVTELATMTPM